MLQQSLHPDVVNVMFCTKPEALSDFVRICFQVSSDVRGSAESLLTGRQVLSIDTNAATLEVRLPRLISPSAKPMQDRCPVGADPKHTLGDQHPGSIAMCND